jgi:hypothetical protein
MDGEENETEPGVAARARARAAAAAAAAAQGNDLEESEPDTDPGIGAGVISGMIDDGAETPESRRTERMERMRPPGRGDGSEASERSDKRDRSERRVERDDSHDATIVMPVPPVLAETPRPAPRTLRSYALPPGVVAPGPIDRPSDRTIERAFEKAAEKSGNGDTRKTLTGMSPIKPETVPPPLAPPPLAPPPMTTPIAAPAMTTATAHAPMTPAPPVLPPSGPSAAASAAAARASAQTASMRPSGRGRPSQPARSAPPPRKADKPDRSADKPAENAADKAPEKAPERTPERTIDKPAARAPQPPPLRPEPPPSIPLSAAPAASPPAASPPAASAIVAPPSPQPRLPAGHVDKVTTPEDRAELRALFTELAGHHMVQLRDFMIEVRCGSALAEWISLSEPAVRSVRGMAEQLELEDICSALDQLLAALADARQAGGAISSEHQLGLLAAYLPLVDLLPGVLELDAERNRREPIIVHSILRQIAGIEKVAIDKLVAANLVSVAALASARADELAQVTGLELELAGRVVDRFRDYRREAGAVATPDPRAELRALATLLDRLRQQNQDYDFAAGSWAPGVKERKRQLRRERAETLLAIHVSLARLGEVDRLVELDRLNFRRKVEFIDSTLQAARTAARARTGGPA